MAKLTDREQNILSFLEKRCECCQQEIEECGKAKKYSKQNEWDIRYLENHNTLDYVRIILRAPTKEYIIQEGCLENE